MSLSRKTYRTGTRGSIRRASIESLEDRKLLAAAGLVAAYAFDEGVGTAASDASGAGNVGALSGATWAAAGKFGSALSFNGTSAIVNVADSAPLDLTTGMTLEAWVRPTSQTGYRTVVMKDVPGELAYSLYGSGDVNRPSAWARIANTSRNATGTAALPLNTWSHLAATYNGSTLLLYVNGIQVASRAAAGAIQTSANGFHVGGNPVWREYFAGLIDEVRVYNRALAVAEIQADMNASVGAPLPPDTTVPTISVAMPAGGPNVTGTVQVTASASDNVAVAGVQFKLDGVNLGAEDTAAPYSVAWNADTASLGDHTLTAVARDSAGNAATSAPVSVTVVDTVRPAVAITSPAAAATVAGSVTLTATALDNRGVGGVQFLLDGNPLGAEDIAAPYSVNWDSTASAGGAHQLTAVARDVAGNTFTSAAVNVTVDNRIDTAPPTVDVTSPAAGATVSGTVTVTATASDNVAVAGVRFLLDGAPVGAEDTIAPYSVAWSSTLTSNGQHTLAARARDAAGNVQTSTPASVTVSNVTTAAGLVAFYSFDEGTGTTVGDGSGRGNNGAVSGASWTAAGKYGPALVFNGTSSIVNVGDSNSLDLTTAMTIEAWVKPSALGGYRTILMKDLPAELSYTLYASGDTNRPSAWGRVSATSSSSTSVVGTAALPLNAWTHLAATYDGAKLVLYVNGAQAATRALSGSLLTSANPLHIGGNAVWGEFFAGTIDEVRVYNIALTTSQIQADMNAAGAPVQTHTLGGTITSSTGGAAATLALTGPVSTSVLADSSGNYLFAGLPDGTYTVSPSNSGYAFSPTSQSVTISGANIAGVDFTATASPVTGPNIQLIQKAVNGNESATATMSIALPSAIRTGSFLIITGTAARPNNTLTLTDSQGNTFALATGPIVDANQNVAMYVWYVTSAIGGPDTFTITPSVRSALEIHVSEWSGISTTDPVDQATYSIGSGATVSSGTRTTTTDGELIFGYGWVVNNASAGAGFTALSLVNGDLDEYRIQTTAGPIDATFTQAASGWVALMVTFRAAPPPAGLPATQVLLQSAPPVPSGSSRLSPGAPGQGDLFVDSFPARHSPSRRKRVVETGMTLPEGR